MNLPPSTFLTFPWESVCDKSEYEAIAYGIMHARFKRGDVWSLTYAEYKAARIASGLSPNEVADSASFKHVLKLIPDAIGAIRFCDDWANAARRALNKA
jgi:hypothetical protein